MMSLWKQEIKESKISHIIQSQSWYIVSLVFFISIDFTFTIILCDMGSFILFSLVSNSVIFYNLEFASLNKFIITLCKL